MYVIWYLPSVALGVALGFFVHSAYTHRSWIWFQVALLTGMTAFQLALVVLQLRLVYRLREVTNAHASDS